MKRVYLYNSLSGILFIVVNAIVQLVSIPVILRYLGADGYGVFILVNTVGMFGYFINIGFNFSVLKFVSEQGVGRESDKDIVLSFSAVVVLSAIITAVIVYWNEEILRSVLGVPERFINRGTISLLNAIVLTNALMFVGQVITAVLDSIKKIYISNSLQIMLLTMNRIGVIAVLIASGSFYEISIIYEVTAVAWFLILLITFFKNWKFTDITCVFHGWKPRLRKHIDYGFKIYMTSLAGFFYEPFAKVLIARYIGINEVGFFDIAFRIKTLVWGVIEKGLYPLMPKIASGSEEMVKPLVHWVSRKLLLLALPFSVFFYFIADPVVRLWLGGNPSEVIYAVRVLVIVHLVTASGIPMYFFLLMKGHPGKTFIIQSLNAFFGVLYFFPLVALYGFQGAIIGFVGAVTTTQLLLIRWQSSIAQSRLLSGPIEIWKSAMIAAGLAAVNIIITSSVSSLISMAILVGIVDGVLGIIAVRVFSIVSNNDIRVAMGRIPFTSIGIRGVDA